MLKRLLLALALFGLHPAEPCTITDGVEACVTASSVTLRRGTASVRVGLAETSLLYQPRLYAVDQGFEVGVSLVRRPETNRVGFTWQTTGLDALYQPAFAATALDGSTFEASPLGGTRRRPADVNGSYAFYRTHATMGEAAKAFHLYRPWAEDATGRRVWCDLQIEGDRLTVTIPQAFLDSATYPIWLDPTFGYTTQGGSQDNPDPHNMILSKSTGTPASSGTLTAIEMFGQIKTSTPHWAPAIYADTAGAPSNRLASINTGGTAISAGIAVNSTAVSYGSITSGVQYWLGWAGNKSEGSTDFFIQFDTEAGNTIYLMGTAESLDRSTGSDWPDPANTTHPIVAAEKMSEYGVYTAAGGSTPKAGGRMLLGCCEVR